MIASSILILLLLGVVGVLMAGVVLMGIGGKANEKYGNKLMIARVTLQGLTLLLVALMFVMGSK